MTAMIFENKIRTNNRPAFYSEKPFEFYDRSCWPAAENVRQLLNTWLLDFPIDGQAALTKRFQTEFDAAFFELLCFTIFKRLGFQFEEHPVMEHTTKRCDFSISDADRSFYLECISKDGFSDEQKALKNTEHLFYDLLDEMKCPNFYLSLKRVLFKGKKTPAFSKARKELQKLVDLINPDDVNMEKVRDFISLLAFQHLDPDFQLEINLIPKPERSRIDDQRNIGVSKPPDMGKLENRLCLR